MNGVSSEQQLTFVGSGTTLSAGVGIAAQQEKITNVTPSSRWRRPQLRQIKAAVVRRLPQDWFQPLPSVAVLPADAGVRVVGSQTPKPTAWLQGAPPKFGPLPQVGGGAGNDRIIWWVNQDQRVADNVALAEAARMSRDQARGGLLLAVYTGSVQPCQTRCALRHLREQLVRLGSDLLVLPEGGGAALVTLVDRLQREHRIQINRIVYNHAINWEGALAERDMVHAVESTRPHSLELDGYWAGNTLFDEEIVRQLSVRGKERNLSFMEVSSALRRRSNGKDSSLKLEPVPERLSCAKILQTLAEESWREIPTATPPAASDGSHGCTTESKAIEMLRRMVRPLCESVTARFAQSNTAELSLVLKSALDLGCVSVRQVLKQVSLVCQGSYEGYTFSEMIWRSYWAFHMHFKAFGTAQPIHSGKVSALS